jgi:hypothetical protein
MKVVLDPGSANPSGLNFTQYLCCNAHLDLSEPRR